MFATFQSSTPFQYSHFPCIHSFIEFYDVDLLLDILICSYIQDIYIFYRSVIFWSFALSLCDLLIFCRMKYFLLFPSQRLAKASQIFVGEFFNQTFCLISPKFLWEKFASEFFHRKMFSDFSEILLMKKMLPSSNSSGWHFAQRSWKPLHRSMIFDHIFWVICLTFLLTSRTGRGGRR